LELIKLYLNRQMYTLCIIGFYYEQQAEKDMKFSVKIKSASEHTDYTQPNLKIF